MTFLPIICLLSILIAPGAPLQCGYCHWTGDDCEAHEKEECSNEDEMCGSIQVDAAISPFSVRTIHKKCFSRDTCALGYVAMNLGNGVNLRINVNCCPDSECPVLPFPEMPFVIENGLHCPGCLGLHTDDCIESQVLCRGPETKCIDFLEYRDFEYHRTTYTLKGCSPSCPTLKVGNTTNFDGDNVFIRYSCTEATKVPTKE